MYWMESGFVNILKCLSEDITNKCHEDVEICFAFAMYVAINSIDISGLILT